MNRRIKNIGLFSVWLAILILFSHAAIPHQYHLNTVFSFDFQMSSETANAGNTPLNCHAFKDLSFDRTNTDSDKGSNIEMEKDVVKKCDINFQLFGDTENTILFLREHDKLRNEIFLKNIPNRGSPYLI